MFYKIVIANLVKRVIKILCSKKIYLNTEKVKIDFSLDIIFHLTRTNFKRDQCRD